MVLGRYNGKGGKTTVTLTGMVGKEKKEFTYEVNFPEQTAEEKPFVEDLWARRKVGYMLDQIRTNGEKKELVDEVVILAKRYGITTPYTSYLVVPDGPLPVVRPIAGPAGSARRRRSASPGARQAAPRRPQKVGDFARQSATVAARTPAKARMSKFDRPEGNCEKLAARRQMLQPPPWTPRAIEQAQTMQLHNYRAYQGRIRRRELDRVQAGRPRRRSVRAIDQPAQPD